MSFFITHERRPSKAIRNARAPVRKPKPIERRRLRHTTLALQRQQIPGVECMLRALQQVENARAELQSADQCLRATLTIVPLAKAYQEFVAEGGVSSADWQSWLQALPLQKQNVLRFKQRVKIDELEDEREEDESDGAA
jgi:hypothetical protein